MNTSCCIGQTGRKRTGIKAHPLRDAPDTLGPPTTEDGWKEGAIDSFRAGSLRSHNTIEVMRFFTQYFMPRKTVNATECGVQFEMVCKGGGATLGKAHDVEAGQLSTEREGEEASDHIHAVGGLKTKAHVKAGDSLSTECIWGEWYSHCVFLYRCREGGVVR